MRRLAILLVTLGLAAPAAAQLPNQLPQPAPAPPPTVVVPPSTDNGSDSGLKGWQQVLIFGAGALLLVGIGWAIVSDARNRAPVSDAELGHPGAGAAKRNRSQKQRQRARAKAKTGRAQRKRNRKR